MKNNKNNHTEAYLATKTLDPDQVCAENNVEMPKKWREIDIVRKEALSKTGVGGGGGGGGKMYSCDLCDWAFFKVCDLWKGWK